MGHDAMLCVLFCPILPFSKLANRLSKTALVSSDKQTALHCPEAIEITLVITLLIGFLIRNTAQALGRYRKNSLVDPAWQIIHVSADR